MGRAADTDVAVIGAGWAGLAAAIHLVKAGRTVRLIDAAPQAGGRARRVVLNWKHPLHGANPIELDNGQHLLLGAYTEVLKLLELLDALDDQRLERRPMRLASSSGLLMERPDFADDRPDFRGIGMAGVLLAPLSPLFALLRAQGLSASSRWAMLRVLTQLRLKGWRVPDNVATVSQWYAYARQPAELVARVWQPLVISALNTPADSACAVTFLRVIRDSLGAGPTASDFIQPRQNLSDLFVDPAIAWLRQHGAHLMLRSDVRRIERGSSTRYRILGGTRQSDDPLAVDCDEVIVATPPYATARLLGGLADGALIAELNRFSYLPISTAYLGWPEHTLPGDAGTAAHGMAGTPGTLQPRRRLDSSALPALLSLRDSASQQRFAQWFFDRGLHAHWRIGALVLSDSRAARELGDSRLTDALVRQVVDELGLPAPAQLSLIHEKRATFACTPDRPRLGPQASWRQLPGIALAGDYTYGDYPATLEGAVRSGRIAAGVVLAG